MKIEVGDIVLIERGKYVNCPAQVVEVKKTGSHFYSTRRIKMIPRVDGKMRPRAIWGEINKPRVWASFKDFDNFQQSLSQHTYQDWLGQATKVGDYVLAYSGDYGYLGRLENVNKFKFYGGFRYEFVVRIELQIHKHNGRQTQIGGDRLKSFSIGSFVWISEEQATLALMYQADK